MVARSPAAHRINTTVRTRIKFERLQAFIPTLSAMKFLLSLAMTISAASAFTAQKPAFSTTMHRSSTQLHAALEAILFDCDGVLADTERDGHRLAFNRAFKNSEIDDEWGVELYGKLLETGGGKERMTAHWNEVGWPDVIPEEGRADKVKALHLEKTDIFMDMIGEGSIPLRPGVLRLVDEAIKNGVRLAVCSTSNEKAVSNLVKVLMGDERRAKFEIFAGDMVQAKKPAPDVYNMAVDSMGLDKSRCVIVEDTNIGLGAALAAGIKCIVTKSSYSADEDFTGASKIVDELGDDISLETLTSLLE
jgi:HAD superfamily hydrolase (TIGR01509 family)